MYLKSVGVQGHIHIHIYFPAVFFYLLLGMFVLLPDQSYQAALNSSALCSIPSKYLISSHSWCFDPVRALRSQGGFQGNSCPFPITTTSPYQTLPNFNQNLMNSFSVFQDVFLTPEIILLLWWMLQSTFYEMRSKHHFDMTWYKLPNKSISCD